MIRFLSIALFFLPLLLRAETSVTKTPPPDWVEPPKYEIPVDFDPSSGSVRYIAVDCQWHLEEQSNYRHTATLINTPSGVEEYSQISISFYPEYQALDLHTLQVVRAGEVQDRLPDTKIETLRREEGIESQLYDGKITAHAVLKDIRPGDTIVYAYTVKGMNPVLRGKTHLFEQLRYGSDVDYIRRRFLWDAAGRNVRWQDNGVAETNLLHNTGASGDLDELLIETRDSQGMKVESDVPYPIPIYPMVEVSDYGSWEEFGQWAIATFAPQDELPQDIQEVCEQIRSQNLSPGESAIEALRWVQENVRYLGSFMGTHTHRPYSLSEISKRRFGDCKDKSTLLIAMLQNLGLDAAPALVETDWKGSISNHLPGHQNFDHAIVHLSLAGKDYWLDPTRTFQGGSLETSYLPDYGLAFVIREGAQALTELEPSGFEESLYQMTEYFVISEAPGKCSLKVETLATGVEADHLRRSFATSSLSEMEESYREFYESDYEGITVAEPLTFSDDKKRNRITITESYHLDNLWQETTNEDGTKAYETWLNAKYFTSLLESPSEKTRKQPFAISHPTHCIYTQKILLPDGWDIGGEDQQYSGPAFRYEKKNTFVDNEITRTFTYRSLKSQVEPDDFPAFKKAMGNIQDEIWYHLYDDPLTTQAGNEVRNSYLFVAFFAILGLLVGVAGGIVAWLWNPQPKPFDPDAGHLVGIGGWLIIPMLGLFLLPCVSLYEATTYFTIIDDDSFTLFSSLERETWQRVAFAWGSFSSSAMFVMSLAVLKLLFSKRSSFPSIYIGLTVLVFAFDLIFLGLTELSSGESTSSDEARTVISSLLGLFIWTAYMIRSRRVRNTFRVQRGRANVLSPTPPPLPNPVGQI